MSQVSDNVKNDDRGKTKNDNDDSGKIKNDNDDSDSIKVVKKKGNDFTSMMVDLLTNIPWKVAILLYILFIIINSDIIMKLMFEGTSMIDPLNNTTTTGGTVVQGIILVLGFIILDMLNRGSFI